MKRILLHIPNPTDTTSLYRGCGPYGHIQRNHADKFQIEAVDHTALIWPHFQATDIFICQRPHTNDQLEGLERAKALGCKIIVDYDDDNFCVPSDNKFYLKFQSPVAQKNMMVAIKMADVVTVSTSTIASHFSAITREPIHKFKIIPNAIDLRWWEQIWKQKREPKNAISWRGGDSHFRDTLTIAAPLVELFKKHEDLVLFPFGYYPYTWLDNLHPKKYLWRNLPVHEFWQGLYNTGAKIGIVPLLDSAFNQAKSNIAWLELTCAGHAVVASDLLEFRKPGVTLFDKPENFIEKVEEALENWGRNHEKSLECIKDTLTLDHVNKARVEILCEL